MGEFFVRCRGLPFSAKETEVKEFLGGAGIKRVKLTNTREGRPSGEAYVECENEESFNLALAKDRQHMGSRYIEVFRCSSGDMYAAGNTKEAAPSFGPSYGGSYDQNIPNSEHVVRLRGLPFQCSKDEIVKFFCEESILPDGVIFPHERLGRRSTGEAYVFFADAASAASAMEKNRRNMQHRYIEVFASSRADLIRALDGNSGDYGQWAGYGGGRGEGYESGYGYGGPRGSGGSHRPTPYDRHTDRHGGGGYMGQGGYGGERGYDRYDRGYGGGGGGYGNDYYGRGNESGYGYGNDQGDWGGYEASYDYGGRGGQGGGGGGGPMRGGRGSGGGMHGGGDNWRSEGQRPIGPRMGGGAVGGGGGGGMKGGMTIKMRGIPFRASEGDIYEFFAPLRPSSIEIVREASGRPSGEARVEFASRQEYDDALLKDKQYMGARYVELFPDHH